MATVLQQTLKILCFKTGWCYAVFWKLKRRSRMVLTWEEGYYEYQSCFPMPANLRMYRNKEIAENPLEFKHEGAYSEGRIGLAVAKMSYYVYFMGEGIIGRVAFTGKHQWVFAGGENSYVGAGSANSRCVHEKYPAGWQNQFAAGIKTIAVVAVPQGVVQLGSTEMIMEDMEWVDHIKAVFASLQNVPGAFVSELSSEGQGGKSGLPSAISPVAGERETTFHQAQISMSNANAVNAVVVEQLVYGHRREPGLVKSSLKLQGPLAIREASEHESDVQQVVTLATEAQDSRTAVTDSGAQNLQAYSTVPQFDATEVINKTIPRLNEEIKSCQFRDMVDMQRNNVSVKECSPKPFSMALTSGIGSKVEADVSTGLHNTLYPEVSCNQEQSSVHGICSFDSISGIERNKIILGVPLVNRTHQQLLKAISMNEPTPLGEQNETINSTSKLHIPPESHSFSQGAGFSNSRLVKYGTVDSLPFVEDAVKTGKETAATFQSKSTKRSNSHLFDDDAGVAATGQDSLCSSGQYVWDREGFVTSTRRVVCQSSIGDLEHVVPCSSVLESDVGSIDSKGVAAGLDDFEKYLASFSGGQSVKSDHSFAIGDELSQALGPPFKKGHDRKFWEEMLLHAGGDQNKATLNQQTWGTCGLPEQSRAEAVQKWGSSFLRGSLSESVLSLNFPESKSEPLLDAVVGNASSSHPFFATTADDSVSCKNVFSGLDSGMSVLDTIEAAQPKHVACNASHECISESYIQAAPGGGATLDTQNASQVSVAQRHLNPQTSHNGVSLKTVLNAWTEDVQSTKSDNAQPSQLKKSEEFSKSSRKRARPGESPRQRPKDRQQIQDRVRELRDIVPNGSKCSIDALLEKTIKHMLFLQSVTLHADKLKKNGGLEDDVESGASWALELGGEETECPIHVKDLNQPRQMLVEMLCEERGLFLEVAHVIRSLGLSILKGVMESRTDKIVARFIVEAKRDVHRVEVLMSLLRLLRLNSNSSSSMTGASQSGQMRPQQGTESSSSQTVCGFQQ